jgi:hypothetical protein
MPIHTYAGAAWVVALVYSLNRCCFLPEVYAFEHGATITVNEHTIFCRFTTDAAGLGATVLLIESSKEDTANFPRPLAILHYLITLETPFDILPYPSLCALLRQ